MKNGIKKFVAILLTLVFVLLSFSSCSKNREYNEAIIVDVAEELIKKSEILNEIYYGKGILYDPDLNYSNGSYFRASQESLDSFGIQTLDELKNKTREIYSTEMANLIINTKLSAINGENGVLSFARYYENKDSSEKYIMVYRDAEILLDGKTFYDYSSVKAKCSRGQVVYVTISAEVYDKEGNSQQRELEIGLLEENGVWKLDTPTYIKYADLDYYDKIQGNKEK